MFRSISSPVRAALVPARQPPHNAVAAILRGAALTLAITAGGVIATYVLQMLLARWLGVAAYGVYVYVWSWASLLAVGATLGFPTALVRFIPEYQAQRDPGQLRGIVRYSVWCVLLCAIGVAIAGSGWTVWLGAGRSRSSSLAVALWAVPLIALATLLSEGLRASGRIVSAYLPFQLLRPLVLGGAAFCIFFLTGELTVISALAATFLAFAVTLGVLGALLRNALPAPAPVSMTRVAPISDRKRWMQVALPLGASTTLNAVFEQAPTVIIGLLLRPAEVGIYYVAARNAALISFVIVSVNALAAPAFSSFYWRGEERDLEGLVTRLSHLIFWPSLAIALLICVFAAPLLGLFGSAFVAGRPVLLVLVVGQLINAGAGSVGYLLLMTGHQLANLNVLMASAIANLILNLILVPTMGCMGAAIAAVLTTALWNIWLHVLVTRRLGLHPSIVWALLRPLRHYA
jgi:O-antigen/teichoic acid export membrane protein